MDVNQKLDEIVAAVRGAKGMPMSASCVINRSDLIDRLDEVREALPGSLAQAREVLGDREQVVADAQQEARRIVEAAHTERGTLVENTEVVQRAQDEAARILAEARREAAEVKAEADDYVDSKLANFEVVLGKTIGSVDRGRDKLLGGDRGDPQELLANADAYVEAQFGAIQAVLRKTLEAVGRGRQKLTGHRPIDELGEHVAEQEAIEAADGDRTRTASYFEQQAEQDTYGYLGMAQPQQLQQSPQEPAQPPMPQHEPAVAAGYEVGADAYAAPSGGYPQDGGYAQQDPYAGTYTYGQDPYGSGGYPQQDPYGGQQQGGGGYGYEQQPQQQHQLPAALDETSLFDTSMIDAEQIRRYQEGRH
ncbi:ATP synthase F0 subunit B [Streptomyces avicenniae]|uniref:ATP synthase F0 subunit B n=1 Tax=Streptomyces avicenniae TaxID=500153 RepID=UPI00069CABA2|nr:ATP synthase F0 subunit B [Streptomyces avicenniae]